jgi:hypothetical protein
MAVLDMQMPLRLVRQTKLAADTLKMLQGERSKTFTNPNVTPREMIVSRAFNPIQRFPGKAWISISSVVFRNHLDPDVEDKKWMANFSHHSN